VGEGLLQPLSGPMVIWTDGRGCGVMAREIIFSNGPRGGQPIHQGNRAPASTSNTRSKPSGRDRKVELPFDDGGDERSFRQSNVEKDHRKRDFTSSTWTTFDQRMEAIAPRAAFVVETP